MKSFLFKYFFYRKEEIFHFLMIVNFTFEIQFLFTMESNSELKVSCKTNSNSSIKFKENKICNEDIINQDDEDIKMNKKNY